ncbi:MULTISPECIES: DUF4190 domain-containing protein [unclassified Streptomyces]|uniref:DUF4190 domain-containing protein n=1 Tax=unclassified Streptomyces TaxID=2593676 RepID=UPI0035DF0A2C
MSENNDQPVDPWAPPNQDGVELSKPAAGTPGGAVPPPVHNQPTVASMPGVELPPPPAAPGGGFGYPTAPAAPQQPGYGYPAAPPSPYGGYGAGYGQPGWGASPSNGMGTAAMVLGIIAVVGFCFYGLGTVLGILALIFGVIGLKKANRGEATNRGMAIAGIVLGAIGALVSSVFLGFIIWAIANEDSLSDSSDDPWATSLVVDARGQDARAR